MVSEVSEDVEKEVQEEVEQEEVEQEEAEQEEVEQEEVEQEEAEQDEAEQDEAEQDEAEQDEAEQEEAEQEEVEQEEAEQDEVEQDEAEQEDENILENTEKDDDMLMGDVNLREELKTPQDLSVASITTGVSLISAATAAYTASPNYDWNNPTTYANNIVISNVDNYTFMDSSNVDTGVTLNPIIKGRNASGTAYTLTEYEHYKLSYSNNTNVGDGVMTITGLGIYAGQTYDYTYKIAARVTDFEITLDGDKNKNTALANNVYYTYTGSVIQPNITSITMFDGKITVPNTYYTVTYANTSSRALGSYAMTFKGVVDANSAIYIGSSQEIKYAIEAKDLSSVAYVEDIPEYRIFGSAITPTVTVRLKDAGGAAASDSDTALTLGTDYTVAYSNNTSEGTATATITGKGNYAGTIDKTFTIKNDSSVNLFAGSESEISGITFGAFTGTALTASSFTPTFQYNHLGAGLKTMTQNTWWKGYLITADDDSDALDIAEHLMKYDIREDYYLNSDAQAALDDAGYPGANNYYVVIGQSTLAGSYTVSEAFDIYGNLSKATVTPTTALDAEQQLWWPWTGSEVKPDYWDVKIGDWTLTEGTDFEVVYPSNITSVGAKTVTIQAIDGKTASGANGAGIQDGSGTGTAGNKNYVYQTITKNYGIEVQAFSIDDVVDVENGALKTVQYFTGDLIVPDFKITLENDHASASTFLTKDVDYTVTCTSNRVAGTATATIKGIGGYDGVSFNVLFTIEADKTENFFGEDGSGDADGSKLTYSSLGWKQFAGTPITATDMTPAITWNYGTEGKTTTLTTANHYDAYLIYAADLDADAGDVDELCEAIAQGKSATEIEQFTWYDDDIYDKSGYPGLHYYLMIGKGMCEGSYWYDTVDVYANLSKGTIMPQKVNDDGDYEDNIWFDWTGSDVKPDAWSFKIGNWEAVEGEDFEAVYPVDIVSTGAKIVTFQAVDGKSASAANGAGVQDGSGTGTAGELNYAYSSMTRNYGIQVIGFDIDDIYGGVTDGKMDITQTFTGLAIDPDIAIWKDYENDYDDQASPAQNPTDNPELFLTKGTDYSYTSTSNTVAGTATSTITGLGGYAGVKFTVDFDILAATDTNIFDGTTTFTTISDKLYSGTALTTANVTTTATCEWTPGKTSTLKEGTTITTEPMIINLGLVADSTAFDLDDFIEKLDASLLADNPVALDATYQAYVDEAGEPGLNLYIIRGMGTFEGSYAAKEFNIKAMLASADIVWYSADPDGKTGADLEALIVDDYFCDKTNGLTTHFHRLYLDEYIIDENEYAFTKTDSEITELGKKVGTTALTFASESSYAHLSGAGDLVIKPYNLVTDGTTVVTYADTVDYRGYTFFNVPSTVEFTPTGGSTAVTLVTGEDFSLSYLNTRYIAAADSALPPTIIVTGKAMYDGVVEENYNIKLNETNSYYTVATIPTQEYSTSKSAYTPTPVVKINAVGSITDNTDPDYFLETYTLTEGVDFVYEYASNTTIGTATIKIVGINDYLGFDSAAIDFKIAANMEDLTISNILTQEYTAAAIELTYDDQDLTNSDFTIKHQITDLVLSSVTQAAVEADGTGATVHDGDFYMTYKNNTEIGTATVTFHAVDTSNYFGSVDVDFEIAGIDFSSYVITVDPNSVANAFGYTGTYVKPEISVDYQASTFALATPAATLVEGKDYTVEYFNNIHSTTNTTDMGTDGADADFSTATADIGITTPYVKITGLGEYEGAVQYQGFDIVAGTYNLFDGATATLVKTKSYDGTSQTQTVVVISTVDPVTGGPKNVFVNTAFTIGGAIENVLPNLKGVAGTYVAGDYDDETDLADNGYTNNVLPGEATIHITGVGDYVDSYVEFNFDVVADLSQASIYYTNGKTADAGTGEDLVGDFDWTGADVEPTLDVIYNYDAAHTADDEHILTYDADATNSMYTITYDETSTNIGSKTITIAPASSDLGKYYIGSLTGSYSIDAIDLATASEESASATDGNVSYVEDLELDYTGAPVLPTLEDLALTYIIDGSTEYTLTEDDVTISYATANNTDGSDNIGTGLAVDTLTCTITGKGNFTGTWDIDYDVSAADADALLANAEIINVLDMVFEGDEVIQADPKVMLMIGDVDTDITGEFDITYTDNLEPTLGTDVATIIFTAKTGSVYEGATPLEETFKITGDLSKGALGITENTDTAVGGLVYHISYEGMTKTQVDVGGAPDNQEMTTKVPDDAFELVSGTVDAKTGKLVLTLRAIDGEGYTGTLVGSMDLFIGLMPDPATPGT